MSSPIGHTFLYNIIIIFILIVFAFISATLSYYKTFKINNSIVFLIEEFEGYNHLSLRDINLRLSSIGYKLQDDNDCAPTYNNMTLVAYDDEQFEYCVYVDKTNPIGREYFQYGVLTYMQIDLPLVDLLKLPVFTRTNRIYKFTTDLQP